MTSRNAGTVHPTAVIGSGVQLGVGVVVGPHAMIVGPATIGDRVWIGHGASIGAPPEISSLRQNVAWAGDLDHQGVVIGADSVIREHVVIHQGSLRATAIGARCWLLNRCYVAHDIEIGDDTTISAGVSIGGHCRIGHGVTIGMNAVVHQRRAIAPGAMVGMGTALSRDVPPFAKVFGSPPRLHGVNRVGMERAGIDELAIEVLAEAYGSDHSTSGTLLEGVDIPALADEFAWWAALPTTRPVRAHRQRVAP